MLKQEGASVLFDGYPRTRPQAEQVETAFSFLKMRLHAVIALSLDFEVLISRMTARRTCSKCGAIVNILLDTLPDSGTCPSCGGMLTHREDDYEPVVRKRIDGYRHETAPLLKYYEQRGVLHSVDALGTVAEVGRRITDILNQVKATA